MNKKMLILPGLLIIFIGAFFLFQSCLRTKDQSSNIPASGQNQNQTTMEKQTQTTKELTNNLATRTNFINANSEFTCELIKNPELTNQKETLENRVRAIYEKYNLPVSDNATMLQILLQYENDSAVTGIIKDNSRPCLNGGEAIIIQN